MSRATLLKNPRVKIVPTRWVDSDKSEVGEDEQLKLRLVVRGDLEYHPNKLRTDSPTCFQLIVNMILAHAASMNLRVNAGDISAAFLQGVKINRTLHLGPLEVFQMKMRQKDHCSWQRNQSMARPMPPEDFGSDFMKCFCSAA